MATLFVSDLHIDAAGAAITDRFLRFLDAEAAHADALYILGDLFESWVGDDAPDAAQRRVIDALRALTARGVPCFVMHGNRDFLLGARFAAETGAELLPDPVLITQRGERVLAMHGDALCTDDRPYQRLRAAVRDPDWQRRFLDLGVAARRSLAGAARAGSRAHTAALETQIADVNADSVAAVLRGAGVETLIHGHTHRPAVHELTVDGNPRRRIVLGDWHAAGSVLRWDRRGFELATLAPGRGG
ncbi:MAG: UDP-2,3-diacylglucosamine diphosphatase [Gammaproteobacteria bacterium]|nr:UDP-2,3-diacylglucosamine diphosphatase [Gammaproteobacteria bacterium]